MQTTILWEGVEYHSLENCVLTVTDTGAEANSVILGSYRGMIYKVEYLLQTNTRWETILFELKTQVLDKRGTMCCTGDGKGNWVRDGKPVNAWDGCIDIDIPLSPFTNTLPINRLKLALEEPQKIKVVYFDILAQEIEPKLQRYTRHAQGEYTYQNVPNDFEARIRVDEQGLVVDYPGLFTRAEKQKSKY